MEDRRREPDIEEEVAERREEATSDESLAEQQHEEGSSSSASEPSSGSSLPAPDGAVDRDTDKSKTDVEGSVES